MTAAEVASFKLKLLDACDERLVCLRRMDNVLFEKIRIHRENLVISQSCYRVASFRMNATPGPSGRTPDPRCSYCTNSHTARPDCRFCIPGQRFHGPSHFHATDPSPTRRAPPTSTGFHPPRQPSVTLNGIPLTREQHRPSWNRAPGS